MRGKVVPVLDLRVPLGLPAAREPGQVVVMLRHEGRLLGLLADGVRGLTRLAANELNAMGCDGAGLMFSGSFERGEDATVVSVLDTAALMRLPGLPLLRDDAGDAAEGVGGVERRALMLVRCGMVGLALDVTAIHATLPRMTLHASSLTGKVCRGVIDHAGQRVPAVDPLALMELGALPKDAPCEALLLRYDSGLVALLVSQVIDIVRVPETDLLPLAPLAVRRPDLFRAALNVAGHGEQLVLSSDALRTEPELLSLATLNTRQPGSAAAATASATASHARGTAVITYDIGAEVATRLIQVSEVLPLPADCIRTSAAHPAVMGMFTYRGHSVTLICLASLLGTQGRPDPATARVMVVSQACGHFGFIVPRLCHIENTVWEQPKSGREPGETQGHQALGPHAVVELGQGAQRRTLHLIDLRALARSLVDGDPAGVALPVASETEEPAHA